MQQKLIVIAGGKSQSKIVTAKDVAIPSSQKELIQEKALRDILEPFIYDTDKRLDEIDKKFMQLLQALNRYTKAINKDRA